LPDKGLLIVTARHLVQDVPDTLLSL